jgi:hypothetical protein
MKFSLPFRRFQTPIHEKRSADSSHIKRRFIIHAGFAKCGNSSIRTALFQNLGKLQRNGISLFGKNLTIARDSADLGTPIWFLERAKDKGEHLTEKLCDEIASIAGCGTEPISILSAENLSTPGMPELFAGLDRQFDVWLIFYLRPQLQWIPSAWKQWGLKKGTPLDEFVSYCIRSRRPSFRLSIETWKSVLPDARIHIRFLIPELLAKGSPAQDFFTCSGCPKTRMTWARSLSIQAWTLQFCMCSRKIRIFFPGFTTTR